MPPLQRDARIYPESLCVGDLESPPAAVHLRHSSQTYRSFSKCSTSMKSHVSLVLLLAVNFKLLFRVTLVLSFLLIPSFFELGGRSLGRSTWSSINASTYTFAACAYSNNTGSGGTRMPCSKREISSLTSSSFNPIRLIMPFCDSPRTVRIRSSFSASRVGLGREALPIKSTLLIGRPFLFCAPL